MKVAIHQPQYLPYPGFFNKVSMVDTLVVMDDVQYDRRFTNRNRILAPRGPIWLTVPIDKSQKFDRNMDVMVNNSVDWRNEHWKKISYSYRNAKWFSSYGPYFERLYSKEHRKLIDLDIEIMKTILAWLDLRVEVVMESELKVVGEGTRRLVSVSKAVGARTYVSGVGGRSYIDESLFGANDISLEYQEYRPRPYRQRFVSSFFPDLSTVDMLFNIGPESKKLIVEQEPVGVPAVP